MDAIILLCGIIWTLIVAFIGYVCGAIMEKENKNTWLWDK